jgi:hypothetical protein
MRMRMPSCSVRMRLSCGKGKVEIRRRGKGSASSIVRAMSSIYALDKALTGSAYDAPALLRFLLMRQKAKDQACAKASSSR